MIDNVQIGSLQSLSTLLYAGAMIGEFALVQSLEVMERYDHFLSLFMTPVAVTKTRRSVDVRATTFKYTRSPLPSKSHIQEVGYHGYQEIRCFIFSCVRRRSLFRKGSESGLSNLHTRQ